MGNRWLRVFLFCAERVIRLLSHEHASDAADNVDGGVVEEADSWADVVDDDNSTSVNLERRYTIGGGIRQPAVLARRKTKVAESRDPLTEGSGKKNSTDSSE